MTVAIDQRLKAMAANFPFGYDVPAAALTPSALQLKHISPSPLVLTQTPGCS